MDKRDVYRLIADPKFKVLAGMLLVSLLAFFGVPEAKQAQAMKILENLWYLATAFVLGHAYVDGKDREGTVPAGRQPVNGGVMLNLGAEAPPPHAEEMQVTPQHKLAAAADVLDELGMPKAAQTMRSHAEAVGKGIDPRTLATPAAFVSRLAQDYGKGPAAPAADHPAATLSQIPSKLGALLLPVLMLVGLAGGCATSPAFQEGAYQAGKHIPRLAHNYAAGDTSIDDVTRATRTEAADELARATAVRKAVRFAPVRDAWRGVRPWYPGYVERDPLIMDDTRALRLEAAREFERLIGAEGKRSPVFTGPR